MVICGTMFDGLLSRVLVGGMEVSDDTKKLMKKMDPFTNMMMKAGPTSILEDLANPYDNEFIKTNEINLGWKKSGLPPGDFYEEWKRDKLRLKDLPISDKYRVKILRDDDMLGDHTMKDSIMQWVLRQRWIFSLDDKEDVFFADNDAAQKVNEDFKMIKGEALPNSYLTWDDMTTDDSLTRIIFYGIGAPLIAAQEQTDHELGPFVVDMPMQSLEQRKGFRPLGCRIHFDEDQNPTGIYDYHHEKMIKPGDDGWDVAKCLGRITVATLVTAREHLLWSHLLMSNTVSWAKTKCLPPSHPLRRLLTIFTFGTNSVNSSAFDALVPKCGLFHRASGFTEKGLKDMFNAGYPACNIFEPFSDRTFSPAIQKLSDDGKFPYIAEGKSYFDIVRKFVQAWMSKGGDACTDEYAQDFYNEVRSTSNGMAYNLPEFSAEAVAGLIAQMIFTVTAYHELVGGVVEYFCLPTRFGFRMTEDATAVDVQSFLIASIISGSTSLKMPMLMKPFKNFFGAGGFPEWETELWSDFITDLEEQETLVMSNEETRDFEYRAFNPRRFECSISV